jgi:hypothetical protein
MKRCELWLLVFDAVNRSATIIARALVIPFTQPSHGARNAVTTATESSHGLGLLADRVAERGSRVCIGGRAGLGVAHSLDRRFPPYIDRTGERTGINHDRDDGSARPSSSRARAGVTGALIENAAFGCRCAPKFLLSNDLDKAVRMELQKAPISHTAESMRADDHGDLVFARHDRRMARPAAGLADETHPRARSWENATSSDRLSLAGSSGRARLF